MCNDMDILRKQEWRLLFASKQHVATSTTPSMSDATFLVKTHFVPTRHVYHILVTDLKQCWIETMEREDIRKRSMSIKTFDYEDDTQLEELLKTLEGMFAKNHSPPATRRLEIGDGNTLILRDEFKYGLANAEWQFTLSPTVGHLEDNIVGVTRSTTGKATTGREARLWDQLAFDAQYPSFLNRDRQQQTTDTHDLRREESQGSPVDGSSLMYEHLSLPLITVLNAYRKQVRVLEGIIKSKELEVKELIDLLDVNGIGHQQRHRATEPYRNSKDGESLAVSNVRADVQQHSRTAAVAAAGSWELFSDPAVPSLCSLVSKNAFSKSEQHPSQVLSSLDPLSQPLSQGTPSIQPTESHRSVTATLLSEPPAPAAPPSPKLDKPSKSEQEEMERRKKLQERLERERIERERKPKKKKLF